MVSFFELRRDVLLVHLNIVVYAAMYWLTQPLLPVLLKQHGASSLSFGAFQALFNVVQLGGGLVVGALQDRTGGASALSVTQLGSALVYLIVCAGTGSLTVLYLSRLPTVLQQAMQVGQAYISKACSGDTRAIALGRLSLSYATGMIAGSSCSDPLSARIGAQGVMLVAAAGSVAIAAFNYAALDRTLSLKDAPAKRETTPGSSRPQSPSATPGSDAEGLRRRARDDTEKGSKAASPRPTEDDALLKAKADEAPGYIDLAWSVRAVLVFLAFLFATRSVYEPVLNFVLLDSHGFRHMGSLATAFAAIGFVVNVLLLPLLLRLAAERTVLRGAIVLCAVAYAAIAVLPERPGDASVDAAAAVRAAGAAATPDAAQLKVLAHAAGAPEGVFLAAVDEHTSAAARAVARVAVGATAWVFGAPWETRAYIACLGAMTAGATLLYTLSASCISAATPVAAHGKAIAMTHALRSAVGIVGPVVGGSVLHYYGGHAVAWINVALLVGAISLAPTIVARK